MAAIDAGVSVRRSTNAASLPGSFGRGDIARVRSQGGEPRRAGWLRDIASSASFLALVAARATYA